MPEKLDMGDTVYIVDLHEAGRFAGRQGVIYGHTKPSASGSGPVIGVRKGRDEDFAWSVFFDDTREQEWFAPHLVRLVAQGSSEGY